MIAFRIKELMAMRGMDTSLMSAALGWDEERLLGILEGRLGVAAEELWDVAHWLDVPMWALMPGPAFRAESDGVFYEAETVEGMRKALDDIDRQRK